MGLTTPPPKVPLVVERLTPSNTCFPDPANTRFLGHTPLTNLNDISITSLIFAEYTVMTNPTLRQTDRQTGRQTNGSRHKTCNKSRCCYTADAATRLIMQKYYSITHWIPSKQTSIPGITSNRWKQERY